jgi:uncharacterized protein involved in response to NO
VNRFIENPYRYFFPLGIALGLWGAAMKIPGFPLVFPGIHSTLMIGGFALAFTAGFLVTAIPKMTGSLPLRAWELLLILVALLLHSGLAAFALLVFVLHRSRTGQVALSGSLQAVVYGLAFGVLGTVANQPLFLNQSMMILIVVGVGGRLLVNILGWGPPAPIRWFRSTLALIAVAFVMEAWVPELLLAARWVRAAAFLSLALQTWRLHRLPADRTRLGFGLWASLWLITAGQVLWAALPDYTVNSEHLIFIGGYSLMVLAVATRVSLAHGGYPRDPETRSPAMLVAGLLVLAAAGARFHQHLPLAAWLWILGVAIWSAVILPRTLCLVDRNKRGPSTC